MDWCQISEVLVFAPLPMPCPGQFAKSAPSNQITRAQHWGFLLGQRQCLDNTESDLHNHENSPRPVDLATEIAPPPREQHASGEGLLVDPDRDHGNAVRGHSAGPHCTRPQKRTANTNAVPRVALAKASCLTNSPDGRPRWQERERCADRRGWQ